MNDAEGGGACGLCANRSVCRIASILDAKAWQTGSRQMTDSSLTRLDALDIDAVVRRLQEHRGNIMFEQRVSMPEADVLCCRYKGERFNVKFDLDYGVFVDRVGKLSGDDIAEIVGWLTQE
ncbi:MULTISPECIES: hypothetical protein [Burkholderia cepacia complex]|uniref:hypothetical protein n=1 Tax=Burkholderia cepacia complex TaxID=87882 RepID=UPI000A5365E3|nr:hypothetical protein [Burkholderia stabilis]